MSNPSPPSFIRVPIPLAFSTTSRAMQALGWSAEAASFQTEVMLWAEKRGSNQGLTKLADAEGMAPAKGATTPLLTRDTPLSAVVDGRQAPGMLALRLAVDTAASKARAGGGLAIVGVNSTSTSSGMLAFFGERLAATGLVGILFATSPEFVSMVPGGAGVFGTNPVCFAFPTTTTTTSASTGGEESTSTFVVDFATAAVAFYGVLKAKGLGQQLPEGSAFDSAGKATTSPDAALAGSLAAFGGHKGAALALCVELLGSALPGAGVVNDKDNAKASNWGHTVIAIDPSLLVDDFPSRVRHILDTVKASGPGGGGSGGGSSGVRLPGERSAQLAADTEMDGHLRLPRNLWARIQSLADTEGGGGRAGRAAL